MCTGIMSTTSILVLPTLACSGWQLRKQSISHSPSYAGSRLSPPADPLGVFPEWSFPCRAAFSFSHIYDTFLVTFRQYLNWHGNGSLTRPLTMTFP